MRSGTSRQAFFDILGCQTAKILRIFTYFTLFLMISLIYW